MLEKILYKPCKYGAETEYWVNFLCPPMIYGGDGKYGYGFDLKVFLTPEGSISASTYLYFGQGHSGRITYRGKSYCMGRYEDARMLCDLLNTVDALNSLS